jgi:hypothetical protein
MKMRYKKNSILSGKQKTRMIELLMHIAIAGRMPTKLATAKVFGHAKNKSIRDNLFKQIHII